ncbi:MAG: tetratricopeptide repeat protein [Candidatus Riflebacteria bacterium]|nr:tetratricopeptide repeat protein [Candidatus Riflebacteria bacterium]
MNFFRKCTFFFNPLFWLFTIFCLVLFSAFTAGYFQAFAAEKHSPSLSGFDTALEHYEEGYRFYRRGDFPSAESHLKKALELEPNLIKAHYWLGKIYREMGQLNEAVFHWEEVIRLEKLVKERHEALQPQNNDYPAITQIQKTLENEKKAKEGYKKARSLMEEGYWEGAIAEIKEAVSLFPKNQDYLLLLARLLKDHQDSDGSLKAYELLLEIPSLSKDIFLEATGELEKQGRKDYVVRLLRNHSSVPLDSEEKKKHIQVLEEKELLEPLAVGKVTAKTNGQAVIDLGMDQGLKLADEYSLEIRSFKPGEQVINPETGKPSGRLADKLSGELLVTKVFANSAWTLIRKEFGEGVKVGDLIEIAQGSKR